MKITPFSKIKGTRQDGAIYNGFLFSFNHLGECSVYKIKDLEDCKNSEAESFAEFTLDKSDIIVPHSNAVVFGKEFYSNEDEFPLLYSNIYNNYSEAEDKLNGVCLVYRLQREGKTFKTTLLQMIEIGFSEDKKLWKSEGEKEDARPYGNFVIDKENGKYYAYTMRDNAESTRYFAFDLPNVSDGEFCEKYNVKKVTLEEKDILEYFDCDYHHFIQGGCCHKGKVYSLEGFGDDENNSPAIRVIDVENKEQTAYQKFEDFGIKTEPEMIDFDDDTCYYSDHHGNMYKIVF